MDKPGWWPDNPYFESAMDSIQSDADFVKAIPDPELRTAVAWYLSNRAWQLASDAIFERYQIEIADLDEYDYRRLDGIKLKITPEAAQMIRSQIE